MKKLLPAMILMILPQIDAKEPASLWLEAESFSDKGGWVVDQQFMDVMASPYPMAHGLGTPVADAVNEVTFPAGGDYQVYVRTCNWTHPWFAGSGPGRFQLLVNGKHKGPTLVAKGAGKHDVENHQNYNLGSTLGPVLYQK